ncbi:hypothetical protein [Mesorhizobium caraganae]|uniref:hypothetical protein n=1 Tax=Mesorhizobium caraganae TaxID=483206 RepID=UPI003338EE3F
MSRIVRTAKRPREPRNPMPASARVFPVLSTSRLLLRAASAKDAEAFGDILSIPDVSRYSNWPDAPTKAQLKRL